MTAVAEVEATVVHAPGTDLATYTAQAIEEYRPRIIMSGDEAAALDKSLRDMMRGVLREDVDFGVIPGTGSKPTLLKPGAEKLLQWFGFGHSTEKVETERDRDGSRLGVTYRCVITKAMQDGRIVTVATCEGYAGYDEDRFYTSAEQAEAKERANAQRYQRSPNTSKFAEYRAPWNSVIKMSQKRALVGAALQATSASTLFTQDLEDMRGAAAPDGQALAEVATAVVMALPDDVREGLDKWYRGKRWPDPDKWTAEQWCTALQMAGYLTAKREQPRPPQDRTQASTAAEATAAPEADPVPDGEDPEAEFVRTFVARTAGASEERIGRMRVELGKAVQMKVIPRETANELGRGLTERMTQLRNAA